MKRYLAIIELLLLSVGCFSQATYFGYVIPKAGSFGNDTTWQFIAPLGKVQGVVQVAGLTFFRVVQNAPDSIRPDSIYVQETYPTANSFEADCKYPVKAYRVVDSIFQYRYYLYNTTMQLGAGIISDNLGNKYAKVVPDFNNRVDVSVPANTKYNCLTTHRHGDMQEKHIFKWYPAYAIIDSYNATVPPIGHDTILAFTDCGTWVGIGEIPGFITKYETIVPEKEWHMKLSSMHNLLEEHGWVYWREP